MGEIREAVVMAAGEGRRLRPFTDRWPKPVLPIDGRPVIATLLRELAAAGIERATIVTGHLAEQVEALAGPNAAFELEVRFARQPRPDGSADAVLRALAAGAEPPCLVSAADTVYAPGDVAAFAAAFAVSPDAGALAVRRGLEPTDHRPGVMVSGGRVERIFVLDPRLPLTAAPLWGLGAELTPFLRGLPGPPFELREAYQRAIDSGVEVLAIEIGSTRDLTFPLDLMRQNLPYLSQP
jgi:CTP:molybdopterin cytidylyltransferase MocA